MSKKPDIKLVQERVANSAIAPSTLRNQGSKGVIEAARSFLGKCDLKPFRVVRNEGQFKTQLSKLTEQLMGQFPKRAKSNYGAARKAINVFLEDALYNRFLCEAYSLNIIEQYLEIPLDSYVMNNILKKMGKKHYLKRIGIRNIGPKDNAQFQKAAKEIADKENDLRVYLDLKYWRRNPRKES